MPEVKKTSNTTGMIQNAAGQQMTVADPKPDKLKDLINMPSVKEMFKSCLAENADSFIASVIDLYNNDRTLQACAPNEVLMECFKAATLKLPINKQLGFAYIVPFKDKTGKSIPTFQLGYKGYIQLCIRTGVYRHINAGPVYEGEFISENRLTGEIDLSGVRTGEKIVGFSAYLETINGFNKAIYWTVEEVNAHAKKYSKSFGYGGGVWATDFEAMATKTVLRALLSKFGIMSVELQNAFVAEMGQVADERIQLASGENVNEVNAIVDDSLPFEVA